MAKISKHVKSIIKIIQFDLFCFYHVSSYSVLNKCVSVIYSDLFYLAIQFHQLYTAEKTIQVDKGMTQGKEGLLGAEPKMIKLS